MSANNKPGLLALYHFSPWFTEELKKRFDVFGPFPTREIAPHMVPEDFRPRVRAIATVGSIGEGGRTMLDALPNVSIIHCYGTGFERMDLKTAKERGIVITNAADSNASAVADIAVGLLLASTRRLCEGDRYIRAGRWERRGAHLWPPIVGLKGAKVGILGLGAIGVRVATRIAAFEAEIGYHSRTKKPDVPWAYLPSALELAEWCDFLIVALRSDASNKHIINMELLKKLGPLGHVVNISRGMAVDEAALADALEGGVIAGAALDVFEEEPIVHPKLMKLENVVMTPHLGGGTRQANRAMGETALANFDAHFAGRPVLTPVPMD